MEIENKNSLEHAFTHGINLFVGAGFSTLAKDCNDVFLPTGSQLSKELAIKFKKNTEYSLPQLSTILENSNQKEFHEYLTKRFTVGSFNSLYKNLHSVNIKSIYTTNIDDLIQKIYQSDKGSFLNDLYVDGVTTDTRGINYLALHGSVKSTPNRYVFDVGSLATIYSDAPRIWRILAGELEKSPTIFIGYGFNDNSVLQTLLSQQTFSNARKEIWVVLRDEDKMYAEFYRSLGFYIIFSNLTDFLAYLGQFKSNKAISNIESERMELLRSYIVPRSIQEVGFQRPIKEFYGGSMPNWCDIMGGQLYKTQHLSTIINSIYCKSKHTVIIGAPVTGKTTLLMQASKECHNVGTKLFFNSLSVGKAEYILKILDTEQATIFVDNLYDSIDAVRLLDKPNIKLVCADRSLYYGIISHMLDEERYDIINVTNLTDIDLQGVYNSLPDSIRGDYLRKENDTVYDRDTLFEFVIRNVNLQNIKERYTEALRQLEDTDFRLAEFLVLCAYMHSCHVPLSFEMAYDYFEDFNYEDVFSLRNDAADIIKDYIPCNGDYDNMDYYYPRSRYIADVIINNCSSQLLAKVIGGVVDKISPIRICDFRIFHKYAFDKDLTIKAFPNWKEGKDFYEKAFVFDRKNPYVLQQGALYLSQKRQYAQAFQWIDKALSMTDDKYFSIRNSHAVILFNANIEKDDSNVRCQLDRSMEILEKCMKADARKRFHARIYSSQAIKYYGRYNDEKSLEYLNTAKLWLKTVIEKNSWDDESRKILDQVEKIIS